MGRGVTRRPRPVALRAASEAFRPGRVTDAPTPTLTHVWSSCGARDAERTSSSSGPLGGVKTHDRFTAAPQQIVAATALALRRRTSAHTLWHSSTQSGFPWVG